MPKKTKTAKANKKRLTHHDNRKAWIKVKRHSTRKHDPDDHDYRD